MYFDYDIFYDFKNFFFDFNINNNTNTSEKYKNF